METFAGPKPFVDNPEHEKNRSVTLETLRSLIATGICPVSINMSMKLRKKS